MNCLSRIIVCIALLAGASASYAALLGSIVTGDEEVVGFPPSNLFGPSNGSAGCQNSGGSVSVTIVDPGIEFCNVQSGGVEITTVDITNNTLTFTDLFNPAGLGTVPTNFTFTFAPGLITSVSELSDTFTAGGINFTFANNVLTLFEPLNLGGGTAIYSLVGPAATVPEPELIALLGLGVAALALARRRWTR